MKFIVLACWALGFATLTSGCNEQDAATTQKVAASPETTSPEAAPQDPATTETTPEVSTPKKAQTKLLAGTGDFTTLPPAPGPSPFPAPEPEGEVVVWMNFDQEPSGQDVEFQTYSHNDYKAETRVLKNPTSGEENTVAFLGGADGEQHSWKPSLGWKFPPQSGGRLKITLDFYQASYDTGSLDFQIVDQHSSKFKEHRNRLVIYNNFVRLQWTPHRWFEDTLTAGKDARWHRLSWETPLPGEGDSEMAVTLDGERIGDIFHRYYPEGAITTLRLYLFHHRSSDIAYYLDNVLIEKLPLESEG